MHVHEVSQIPDIPPIEIYLHHIKNRLKYKFGDAEGIPYLVIGNNDHLLGQYKLNDLTRNITTHELLSFLLGKCTNALRLKGYFERCGREELTHES